MITLSVEEAFAAYEAVRHRLPPARAATAQSRHVPSLAALVDDFDVFLLDAFGVLNIGDTAIPGTRARIDTLRGAGKRVLVISNAASQSCAELAEKYRALGYDFAEADIVTSRATLAAALNGRQELHWGLMAPEAARFDDFAKLHGTRLADDPAAYASVDGFLLIGSGDWTDTRQALLEAALLERPRPVLVANPDVVAPREYGFSAEPGHFAHRLADRSGVTPEFFGKPFANIFEAAFARLGDGIDRARMLMVGDSLHTDILGAQTAGIASALVAGYGFLAGQDVNAAVRTTGIVPDFVIDRP